MIRTSINNITQKEHMNIKQLIKNIRNCGKDMANTVLHLSYFWAFHWLEIIV